MAIGAAGEVGQGGVHELIGGDRAEVEAEERGLQSGGGGKELFDAVQGGVNIGGQAIAAEVQAKADQIQFIGSQDGAQFALAALGKGEEVQIAEAGIELEGGETGGAGEFYGGAKVVVQSGCDHGQATGAEVAHLAAASCDRFWPISFRRALWGSANLAAPSSISLSSIFC